MKTVVRLLGALCFLGLVAALIAISNMSATLSRMEATVHQQESMMKENQNLIQSLYQFHRISVYDIVLDRDYPSPRLMFIVEEKGKPPRNISSLSWNRTSLPQGKYRLLLSGIDSERQDIIFNGAGSQVRFFPDSTRLPSFGYNASPTPREIRNGDVFIEMNVSEGAGDLHRVTKTNIRVLVTSDSDQPN